MLLVFTCVFQVKWKDDTCYMVAGRRGVFLRQTECRFLWCGGKEKDVEGRRADRWRDAGNNDLFCQPGSHECYCTAGVNATSLGFSGWLLEHVNTHLPLYGRGGCHDKAHAFASFYFFYCPFLFLNSLFLTPSSFLSSVFFLYFCMWQRRTFVLLSCAGGKASGGWVESLQTESKSHTNPSFKARSRNTTKPICICRLLLEAKHSD